METLLDPTLGATLVCCGDTSFLRDCGIEATLGSDYAGGSRLLSHDDVQSDPVGHLAGAHALVLMLDRNFDANRENGRFAATSGNSVAEVSSLVTTPCQTAAPEYPGLAILRALRSMPTRPSVILLMRNGTPLDVCCAAVEAGVLSMIEVDSATWRDQLATVLRQTFKRASATRKQATPIELLDSVGIMAISPAMQNLIVQAYRAAQVSDATVLIHGESGTGKQLLAEAIHRLDPKRGSNPFVPVNCAAITGTLAESELFGHARGAFSGATGNRAGYFKSAHKGTIMLDEVSELPMSLQPKLLRVLQEGRVMAVGADHEEAVDVRVIAASNISLAEKVANGTFRLDLYQRLNVIHLQIPPLRQRLEDLPLLVQHFLKKYRHYTTVDIQEVDPNVYELLKRRLGNGNVRELENVIRQTLVFKESGTRLELGDLPKALLNQPETPIADETIPTAVVDNMVKMIRDGRLSLRSAIDAFEKTIIRRAVEGNPHLTKSQIAQTLGLPRRTLYHKLDHGGTSPEMGKILPQ